MNSQIQETITDAKPGLTPFQHDEKWGYKNNQGKIVIDPVFDYAPEFKLQTELLIITNENEDSQYYLYDRSGNQLFCFNELFEDDISEINRYKESQLFYIDVCDWNSRELTGMVNEEGQIIIPAKFDSIDPIGEDMFKVGFVDTDNIESNEVVKMQYGIYSIYGKEVFTPQFSEVGQFDHRFAIADLNGKQVLINDEGKIVSGTESNSIEHISRIHYFLNHDNGVQLFGRPNEFGGTYDNLRSVDGHNIYFIGERKGLSVLIDLYMNELGTYDSLEENGNYLIVSNHEKWGVIDYRNQVIIPLKYESVETLTDKNYNAILMGEGIILDHFGKVIKQV